MENGVFPRCLRKQMPSAETAGLFSKGASLTALRGWGGPAKRILVLHLDCDSCDGACVLGANGVVEGGLWRAVADKGRLGQQILANPSG